MPSGAKIALHSDFSIEQTEDIQARIRVVGKKEAFWYNLCEHDTMPKVDKMKYRHQILIDPEKIHVLTENVTPDPTSVSAIQFEVDAFNIGSWFKYSRESRDLNKDSIVEMGANQLAHERLYDLETIRGNAYRGTTCVITKSEATYKPFLLRAKTQLKKNKAKPFRNGHYLFVAPGEIINPILEELGDALKAVPTGEKAIVEGVIGVYSGFEFVENDDESMYYMSGGTQYASALMIGLNQFGEKPVKERSYNGVNDHIGGKGCEPDKTDPMGNWGFISSRIDGVTAVLADETAVLKYSPSITLIPQMNKMYIPTVAAYSATSTYALGDLCLKDGKVYKCTTAISEAEAWTSGHWTVTNLSNTVKGAAVRPVDDEGNFLGSVSYDGTADDAKAQAKESTVVEKEYDD